MFQKTILYQDTEISQILFEEGKRYLLIVAQNCDIKNIVMKHSTDIYTVIFPAVIYGNKLYENGVLVCELKNESTIVQCACNHDMEEAHYMETLAKSQSILLFVHWLDPKIYQYLDRIFSYTREEVSIMGAGCGRTSMETYGVMTKNGVELKDGFLVILSEQTLHIGSKHGATFYNGCYIAHTQNGNKIMTIHGEPAASFYRKMIRQYFNEEVTPENIFSIGLKYPLGLGGSRGENPVRIPVAIEGDSIIVAGPMDDESTVSLMCINDKALLSASSIAVNRAKQGVSHVEDKACFIVECVGRKLVLGEKFSLELDTIALNLLPAKQCFGVLSLGEIANSSDKYIEYSNESCVIGVF